MPFKFIKIPDDFICPITQELIIDPVFTADGETYEREAIVEWLTAHDTSPNTNEKLEHKQLTPNRNLKSQISEFVAVNRKSFELELMSAVKQGDMATTLPMIKLGINVNIQDTEGWTPLHHAAHNNELETVNLLLDRGANIDEASANLRFSYTHQLTPINQLIKTLFLGKTLLEEQLSRYDLRKAVNLYDKLNDEVNLIERKNALKLQLDSLNHDLESQKRNLVSVDTPSNFHYTKEEDVKRFNNEINRIQHEIKITYLEYAISCNSNIMSQTNLLTNLQYAKRDWGNVNIAQEVSRLYHIYLKEKSSNELVTETRKQFNSPLFKAILERKQMEIMGIFCSLSIRNPTEYFDFDTIRKIILTECQDIGGVELLEIKQRLHVIEEQILQENNRLKYYMPNCSSGCTALMIAAFRGQLDIVRVLLTRNANPLKVDSHQSTLIHWAVRSGQAVVVKFLLKYGIDVNAQDEQRNTALDIARAYKHVDCIKCLENHIQEQQTLSTLDAFLEPLRQEIRDLKQTIQSMTSESMQPSINPTNSNKVTDLSSHRRSTFLDNLGQLSNPQTLAQAPKSAVLESKTSEETEEDSNTCRVWSISHSAPI